MKLFIATTLIFLGISTFAQTTIQPNSKASFTETILIKNEKPLENTALYYGKVSHGNSCTILRYGVSGNSGYRINAGREAELTMANDSRAILKIAGLDFHIYCENSDGRYLTPNKELLEASLPMVISIPGMKITDL